METSKLEGPATCLTFLGIEFDTVSLQIRLPSQKLFNLKSELSQAVSRKCITKRNLQSLAGLLQYATKVIHPGRAFLHRLYALQSIGHSPFHRIRLNVAARGDILWWHVFASEWNGLSLLWNSSRHNPDVIVFSDASGSWGCGAFSLYTGKTRSIYVSGRDPYLYRIYTLRLYPFEAGIILKSTCSLKRYITSTYNIFSYKTIYHIEAH